MADTDFGDVTNVVPLRRERAGSWDIFLRANLLRAKEDLRKACRLFVRAEELAQWGDASLLPVAQHGEDEALMMLMTCMIDYLRAEFEREGA